jgi:hypothetical protein
MNDRQTRVVSTREQAHAAAMQAYSIAKLLIQDGRRAMISVCEEEDDRSLKQNKFYWGPCLGEISHQAKLNGVGFDEDGWNWYFKRKFLGYRFKKVMVPGNKRVSVIKELISTKDLSVRKMSTYLDKVQAHAATDFGVEFSCPNWVQWNGSMVDLSTGELVAC